MLSLTLVSLLLAASPLANTQTASLPDLSKLPQCAQGPATSAIASTACTLTDFTCICKAKAFRDSVQTKIQAACSPADQAATLAFANSICGQVGVDLAPTSSAAAAPGPTSGGSGTAASVGSGGSSAASGAPSQAASSTAVSSAVASGVAPSAPASNSSRVATGATETPVAFEGGAGRVVVGFGGMVVAVVAVVFAF